MPAAGRGTEGDVVPDGPGGRLGGDFAAQVGELHWTRQPVPAVRPVRQVPERRGQLDLQPPLVRVPPECFVAPRLVLLPVGGEKPPGGLPLRPPLILSQPGRGQAGALTQQVPPAPRHRHRPRLCPPLNLGQAGLQRMQADLLGVPLGRGRVPAQPSRPPARRDGEPCPDPPRPRLQARPLRTQVLLGEPDLVLAGPGDRPGPARRRPGGQRPLPFPPRHRAAFRVQSALRAPGRQVTPGQRPQVRTHGPQHRRIPWRDPQPGADPRSRRRSRPPGGPTPGCCRP